MIPPCIPLNLIEQAGLHLSIRLARYEGSLPKEIWSQSINDPTGIFEPDFAGAQWKLNLDARSFARDGFESADFLFHATVNDGEARQVALSLEFEALGWSVENFVVMPGGVYDGNRFLSFPAGYPPIAAKTGTVGPHAPIVINDIPRLSNERGTLSRLQQLSADMATPAIGFFAPETEMGVWIFTPQSTRLGLTGFDLEESLDRQQATIRLTAPGIREGGRYHCFQTDRESPDRAVDWGKNETALLQARIFVFPCKNRLMLLRRFTEFRHTFHPSGPIHPSFPLGAARALIEEKYNRDNWDPALGIYAINTLREERSASWQSGWVGGGMSNYPLMAQGAEVTEVRSRQGLDFICAQAVSPSGFFKSMYQKGKWEDDSFGNSSNGECWHMTRKSADLLLFLVKEMDWIGRKVPAPVSWQQAARNCAKAFVKLWNKEGQIGQFVDENTGELLVGQSDSAAILPAALARAGEFFKDDTFRKAALETGEDFWQRFERQGFTTGGPGEILSAPDSESAFGLLEGFVTLWETTGDAIWLTRAEAAADYCATWCVSYDFVFPINSTFGSLHMTTTGTVIANAQNKHSSPGICTLSGDSLFRLYRATGRRFYLDLIQQIATSLPQFVSREDRPIVARWNGGSMPSGWICERVNLSDWLEPVGEIFRGSCWCEVSLLLTALELPSIYFRPDSGLLVSLDHVEARILERGPEGWLIEVSNPTSHATSIRMLVETSEASKLPLPPGRCAALKGIELAPYQTIRFRSTDLASL